MKKGIIGALVGTMCFASLTGCGNKTESVPASPEAAIETAVGTTDNVADVNEGNGGEVAQAEPGVEQYAASDEITNAKFEDHIIQIGDDIFQEGGYITFGELLDQLGDRYTSTEMTAEGLLAAGKTEGFNITKNDSDITLRVVIVNDTEEQISAKDAVVTLVIPQNDFATANTFIAGGLDLGAKDMSYSDVVDMLKADGYYSTATSKSGMISNYYAGSILEAEKKVAVRTVGKDKNLLGAYPVIGYAFMIDTSVNKVEEIQLSDGTTDGFIDAFGEDRTWVGVPVTSYDEISDEALNELYEEVKEYLVEDSKRYSDAKQMENLSICESYILNMKDETVTLEGTEYNATELYVIVQIDGVYDETSYQGVAVRNLVNSVIGNVQHGKMHGEYIQESIERVYTGTGSDYKEELILDSAQ